MSSAENHSVPDGGDMPRALDGRHLARRVGQLAAVGALSVLAISTVPELDRMRDRLTGADGGWLVAAAVLEVGSMAAFVLAFRGVFCQSMPWGFASQIALSQQAANALLPSGGAGGLALGAWALRRGGMPSSHIARRSVAFWLVTSAANFAAVLLIGVLAATGLLRSGASTWLTLGMATLATIGIVSVTVLPRILRRTGSPRALEPAPRWRRAMAIAARTGAEGVDDAGCLLRSGGATVIGGAVGYMVLDIAVLAAAFAAVGDAPALADLTLAYLLGQLGGLIPIPGGIGGTDGGLVAALVLFGAPLAPAAAAVLAYRVFQLGLPVVTGSASFAALRRTLAREEAPASRCAAPAAAGRCAPA